MARVRSYESDSDVTMSDLVREAVEQYVSQPDVPLRRVAEDSNPYEAHSSQNDSRTAAPREAAQSHIAASSRSRGASSS